MTPPAPTAARALADHERALADLITRYAALDGAPPPLDLLRAVRDLADASTDLVARYTALLADAAPTLSQTHHMALYALLRRAQGQYRTGLDLLASGTLSPALGLLRDAGMNLERTRTRPDSPLDHLTP